MGYELKQKPSTASATVRRILQGAAGVGLAATMGLCANVALAQQASDQQPTDVDANGALQEVVVTARFRSENLQSTPISITALTADDLKQQQIQNVNDIGATVPNAYFRQPTSNFGPTETIGLRGFTQTDFDYGFQPTVGFYIDDLYQGSLTGSSFDLADIERVEVLNGPQGTLFGMNSIGGAIRLITQRPKDDTEASAQLTYGEKHRLEFVGVFNTALIDHILDVRIVGVSRSEDSIGHYLDYTCTMKAQGQPASVYGTLPQSASTQQGCELGGLGGFSHQNARIELKYTPVENLEVNLNAAYSKQADDPPLQALLTPYGGPNDFLNNAYSAGTVFPKFGINYAGLPAGNPHFVSPNPWDNYASYGDIVTGQQLNPQQTLQETSTSATLDYTFADAIHLKYIWGYRTYNTDWANDSDLTPFGLEQTAYYQLHRQFQNEIRLSGELLDERLNWTVGGFDYNARDVEVNGTNFDAYQSFGLPNNVTTAGYTTNNISGFVHLDFKLTQQWSVSAGWRLTDQYLTNSYTHLVDDPIYAADDLVLPTPVHFSGSRGDWSGALNFQATSNLFFYAQAASGFTLPGFNSRVETLGQLEEVVPGQAATNYELGAKTDWFDHRLRINASVFYEDYKSYLNLELGAQCSAATSLNPGTPYFLAGGNCPAGTALAGTPGLSPWFYYTGIPAYEPGAELQINAAPIDRLLINLSGGWLEFHAKNEDLGAASPGYINPSVRLQPEFNASGGIQYGVLVPGGTITPRLDWRYQGYQTNGPENVYQISEWRVPGYSLFNARLTYAPTGDKWNISVQALNLFNKFYWEQLGSPLSLAGGATVPSANNLSPAAAQVGTPGVPREWMVSFGFNF
jgi:iron complex outermembrane recepter protein